MSRPVGEMGAGTRWGSILSLTGRDEAELDHAFPSLEQSGG
jgi:hypothetical protein